MTENARPLGGRSDRPFASNGVAPKKAAEAVSEPRPVSRAGKTRVRETLPSNPTARDAD